MYDNAKKWIIKQNSHDIHKKECVKKKDFNISCIFKRYRN